MGLRTEIKTAADRWEMGAEELARVSGVSRWSVRRYLDGKNDLAGEKIDQLLVALALYVTSHKKYASWGRFSETPPPKRAKRKEGKPKKPRGRGYDVEPADPIE